MARRDRRGFRGILAVPFTRPFELLALLLRRWSPASKLKQTLRLTSSKSTTHSVNAALQRLEFMMRICASSWSFWLSRCQHEHQINYQFC